VHKSAKNPGFPGFFVVRTVEYLHCFLALAADSRRERQSLAEKLNGAPNLLETKK